MGRRGGGISERAKAQIIPAPPHPERSLLQVTPRLRPGPRSLRAPASTPGDPGPVSLQRGLLGSHSAPGQEMGTGNFVRTRAARSWCPGWASAGSGWMRAPRTRSPGMGVCLPVAVIPWAGGNLHGRELAASARARRGGSGRPRWVTRKLVFFCLFLFSFPGSLSLSGAVLCELAAPRWRSRG